MLRTLNTEMAERLIEIRRDHYREDAWLLALALGIPELTWRNYEAGVIVPATIVLKLIEMTGVEPTWLLTGTGPKYRRDEAGEDRAD